jgi:hypothetical protein
MDGAPGGEYRERERERGGRQAVEREVAASVGRRKGGGGVG